MIKYSLISVLVLLMIMSVFSVSAEEKNTTPGVCYIEETSEVLDTYLKNNRKLIENIKKELLSTPADDYNPGDKLITKVYNRLFNWDGYEATFEYYIPYSLSNEAPREVKRDLRKIVLLIIVNLQLNCRLI